MRVCPFCSSESTMLATCCVLCCVPFFPMFYGVYTLFPEMADMDCHTVAMDPPQDCCICLESMEVGSQIQKCKHVFHAECLQEWFKYKRVCPLCRE